MAALDIDLTESLIDHMSPKCPYNVDEILEETEEERSRQSTKTISLDDHLSESESLPSRDGDGSTFLRFFFTSHGPPQVILLCLVLALSLGSTIGVVPAVVTDRYARLNHGFDGADCATFGRDDKPEECLQGSSDAQNASAAASFMSNGLTFVTSSLVGSISDQRGRKGVMLLGLFLSLLAPFCLVLLQLNQSMSPTYYYAAHTSTGIINWVTVALSALSDVVPKKWRAPSFGLLLAGFSCGFAFSPILALALSHRGVSILSFSLLVGGFFFAVFLMPETLPPEIAQEAIRARDVYPDDETTFECAIRTLLRPMKELSILNRNKLFRLLSALAFFSGMSSAGDQSLLIYYLEERLEFNDRDVALLFIILGFLGIFVQGFVLKPLNDLIGEKLVVIVAFLNGALHNVLYGIATDKRTIFVAIAVGSFTGMSFPTISAIKSNNVEEHEQGRIQGALYSLSSLASAVGPVSLRFVYHFTKDNEFPGPGTMFLFAAMLYIFASFCACALPKDKADSRTKERTPILLDDPSDDGAEMDYGGTTNLL